MAVARLRLLVGDNVEPWGAVGQPLQTVPELARVIDEIADHGAQVKDIDEGLIDFPALSGGETVLLCWQLGEDEIRYWHSVEDGFAGRRELPLDD